VGRGELKHVVVEGAGRQEGGLWRERRSRGMFVAALPVGKGARLPRRWGFPPALRRGMLWGSCTRGAQAVWQLKGEEDKCVVRYRSHPRCLQ
jgi:hypothetical protein